MREPVMRAEYYTDDGWMTGPADATAHQLAFRPLARTDAGLVHRWLHAPHVSAWWRERRSGPRIDEQYGPRTHGTEPTAVFVIESDRRPVGLIQCYRIADYPDWDRALGIPGAAGIDYLIGEPGDCGRGLGSRAIRQFSAGVFDHYPDLDVIVAAPQHDNRASCGALARAGYTCLDIRELDSDDPADAGPTAIYVLHRHADEPPAADRPAGGVPDTEPLAGGGVNHVVRVGSTVRRPAGAWTPTVHRLLDHLAAARFTGAPRARGFDAHGREVLDFVPGVVGHDPLPGYARSDITLRAVAGLLRDYHDATASFVPPPRAAWYFPAREPVEVICHGDVAPYNCVFRDGWPVAFIDFDTAHPGPRIWDVAYAAYRFVPLTGPGHGEAVTPVGEQARRLRLFCDAYRLGRADRAALVDTARARLEHLVHHMYTRAAAGDAAFAAHIAQGHDQLYRADSDHLTRHRHRFDVALG